MITCARQRMVRGQMQYNRISRFVSEIPAQVLEEPERKTRFRPQIEHRFERAKEDVFEQAMELFRAKPMVLQTNSWFDTVFDTDDSSAGNDGRAGLVHDNGASADGAGLAANGTNPAGRAADGLLHENNTQAAARKAGSEYEAAGISVTAGDTPIRRKLGYDVGDLVRHQKFGEGMVVKIVSGGRDYEVTVQFHQAGVKKMFAAFAKLKKVEL